MKITKVACIAASAALMMCLTIQVEASGSGTIDKSVLQELKTMLEQQQAQIDKQAAEIAVLKEQLTCNTQDLTTRADQVGSKDKSKIVTSSFSNVDLSFYGQVNRAFLYSDNGDSNDWYFVDNSNSQTRLGLNASIDTESGWIIAGRIEYGIVSNGSADVNQLNTHDATSSNFKLRWAEVSGNNTTFGKVSLGKGSSATDGTAETDLSGTSVAAYASISDTAGGMLWFDKSTDTLSSLKIKNVFSDFDGLGRTDRIRYDTPPFGGFALAFSASSEETYDGALLYNRKFGSTKIAAAFGAANPGDLIYGTDIQYSGSASILLPMGLNATVSGAYRDFKKSDRNNPTNWYAKLGYKTSFYDTSTTAFSFDLGQTNDLWADDDEAKTWGFAAVHSITDWNTEFYLVYRTHKLESKSHDYDDIYTVMSGARLKF